MAAGAEVTERLRNIGNLGVPEMVAIEDRAAPIDHADRKALRTRQPVEPCDKGQMLVDEDRPITADSISLK